MQKSVNKGFSFLEISVVLLVIGSLAVAIFVADSLVQAANARSVINEIEKYEIAVTAFRDLYKQLPGDMSNASTLLDASAVNGNNDGFIYSSIIFTASSVTITDVYRSDCYDSPSKTCDGDAVVAPTYFGDNSPFSLYGANELAGFFHHLTLSALIPEKFDGTKNTVSPGTNIGKTKIRGDKGFIAYYHNKYGKHVLYFGIVKDTENTPPFVGSGNNSGELGYVTPFMAYTIDLKLDDGLPTSGKILGLAAYPVYWLDQSTGNEFCITNFTDPPVQYDFSEKLSNCQLEVKMSF